MKHWSISLVALCLLSGWNLGGASSTNLPAPSGTAIKRSSSAIAITADGTLLLAVNPDSNSLSVVDLAHDNSVAEISVGEDPRTVAVDDAGMRAYVANRGSASVSVVDLPMRKRVAEIATGCRPYGVVVSPDGDRLFVAEQGANRVRIVNTRDLTTVALAPTRERPSGLAISDDGVRLYITHLLSNTLTVMTVRPRATYLPSINKAPSAAQDQSPAILGPISYPASSLQFPTTAISLWPSSNLVQSIVIAPDGRRAWVPHTRSNSANRTLTFDTTVFPVVTPVDLATGRMLPAANIPLDTVDRPVGLPFDAAFMPDGRKMWIVNAASNDVSVIDLSSPAHATHLQVGDAPRGIVVSPNGTTAYVNNTLAGTVSVIDAATYRVTETIAITQIPLPPALLLGKRLFNSSADPRMSKLGWIACSTCHFDGENDGRTWFFSFAGPRNTTSLAGMVETYPLRWSGEWNESADSEFVIRRENFGTGLIDGPVNCTLSPVDCVHQPPNQGRSFDLDALALYLDSLEVAPSPYPLEAAARRGQATFERVDTRCAECHPAPLFTDLEQHDVGTSTGDERISQAYDTPSLRGLWNSAPYLHDGSAETLRAVLTSANPRDAHGVTAHLTEQEVTDLIAYMMALPSDSSLQQHPLQRVYQ